MHSLFSSLPALLRPSAPSSKRPYSPSPLRALVSSEYSSKHHHPARTLSPGTRASKLEMSPCAGVTTGKDAGPGNWKGNCESATMLRSSQVSVPWVSLPSVKPSRVSHRVCRIAVFLLQNIVSLLPLPPERCAGSPRPRPVDHFLSLREKEAWMEERCSKACWTAVKASLARAWAFLSGCNCSTMRR